MPRRIGSQRPGSQSSSTSRLFFRRVYALVRLVPRGRVVTYGQVAALLGQPRAARAVGGALRKLPDATAKGVPWHRVVNSAGRISGREGDWGHLQRELLEIEGVRFRKGTLDLERIRWDGPGRRGRLSVPGGSRPTPRRRRRSSRG